MAPRRQIQVCGVAALLGAGVVLMTPVAKTEALWAVTVRTEATGLVPVGTESTQLIWAALSDGDLLAASNRRRLAVSIALLGLSGGIGLTLLLTRRYPR